MRMSIVSCKVCGRHPEYHHEWCHLAAWNEKGEVSLFVKGDPSDDYPLVQQWLEATEALIGKEILPDGVEGMYGYYQKLVDLANVSQVDGTQDGIYVSGTPEELLERFPDRKDDIKAAVKDLTGIAAKLTSELAQEKRKEKALKKVEEARKALEKAQREAKDLT